MGSFQFTEAFNRTANAISPIITKQIADKQARDRKRKLTQEKLQKQLEDEGKADKLKLILGDRIAPGAEREAIRDEFGFSNIGQTDPVNTGDQEFRRRIQAIGIPKGQVVGAVDRGVLKSESDLLQRSPLGQTKDTAGELANVKTQAEVDLLKQKLLASQQELRDMKAGRGRGSSRGRVSGKKDGATSAEIGATKALLDERVKEVKAIRADDNERFTPEEKKRAIDKAEKDIREIRASLKIQSNVKKPPFDLRRGLLHIRNFLEAEGKAENPDQFEAAKLRMMKQIKDDVDLGHLSIKSGREMLRKLTRATEK